MPARLEISTFEPKIPKYDYRADRWSWRPEQLKSSFETFPLTRKFVDWVASEGFQIVSVNDSVIDSYTIFEWREILLSNSLPKDEIDLNIMHELIRIAVPYATGDRTNNKIEDAIDEIALPYSKNENFMNYVKGKIPYFCKLPKNRIVPSTKPIIRYNKIQYLD